MTSTGNELADIIRDHWALLWPLPTRERMNKLEEITKDYEYERDLQCVAREMAA